MTFEHRSLPAYLALCLGLACAFAVLPVLITRASNGSIDLGGRVMKAQHRIAPGWIPGEPSAVASIPRLTQAALEVRP